jgi:hypothetical protein
MLESGKWCYERLAGEGAQKGEEGKKVEEGLGGLSGLTHAEFPGINCVLAGPDTHSELILRIVCWLCGREVRSSAWLSVLGLINLESIAR